MYGSFHGFIFCGWFQFDKWSGGFNKVNTGSCQAFGSGFRLWDLDSITKHQTQNLSGITWKTELFQAYCADWKKNIIFFCGGQNSWFFFRSPRTPPMARLIGIRIKQDCVRELNLPQETRILESGWFAIPEWRPTTVACQSPNPDYQDISVRC